MNQQMQSEEKSAITNINMDEPMLHEPHLDALPPKSALVTAKKKKKKSVALTWDEHAIEEHDQLRGTRMKVRSY